MKDVALEQFKTDQEQAAEHLYDAGFVDGVASVPSMPGGGISADQEAADIAAAVDKASVELHAEVDAANLAASQAVALKDAIKAKLAALLADIG